MESVSCEVFINKDAIMFTVHLGNILDVFTVLSFVLALYSLVLSLWFANLTIIAVLLFFSFKMMRNFYIVR